MDFEPFLNYWETIRNCSPQTIQAYRNDLELFEAFLQGQSVADISQVDHLVIANYIKHMEQKVNLRFARIGLAESSIARRLSAVSAYFKYLCGTSDPMLQNPLSNNLRKWHRDKTPKPVDDMTLELLITGMTNIRDRALFTLLLASGLRVSEMHQLNRDSIGIEVEVKPNGQECVIGTGKVVGKGNKPRSFFVDEETLCLYSEYVATRADTNPALFLSERKKRMSVRAIQQTLATWCTRLGAPHINVHRLRHSFATRLANADIPDMVLKDLLGHDSFSTTLGYRELSDKSLARSYFSAMERVSR
jgi:site-specific recombinase XerD